MRNKNLKAIPLALLMIAAGGINANAKVSVDSTYEVLGSNTSSITFLYGTDESKNSGNIYNSNESTEPNRIMSFDNSTYRLTSNDNSANNALQLSLTSKLDITNYDRLVVEFDSAITRNLIVALAPETGSSYWGSTELATIDKGRTKYVLDLTNFKSEDYVNFGNNVGTVVFLTPWGTETSTYDFKSVRFEQTSSTAQDYEEIDYSTGFCADGNIWLVDTTDYYTITSNTASSEWRWDVSDIGSKAYNYLVIVPRKSYESGDDEYWYGIRDGVNEITGWGFAYGGFQFHRGMVYDLNNEIVYVNSNSTTNKSSLSTTNSYDSYYDQFWDYYWTMEYKDTIEHTIYYMTDSSNETTYSKDSTSWKSVKDTTYISGSVYIAVDDTYFIVSDTSKLSSSIIYSDTIYVSDTTVCSTDSVKTAVQLYTMGQLSYVSLSKGPWYSNEDDVYEISAIYFTNQKPTYTDTWESTNDLAADYVRTAYNADTYGTICLPYASAVCGAYVYDIVGVDSLDNPKTLYLQEVKGVLEAGKGYLFISNTNRYAYTDTDTASTTYNLTVTNAQYGGDVCFYRAGADTVTAVVDGALIGNLWSDTLTVKSSTDSLFYVLTSSIANNDTTYTFKKANSSTGNKVPQYRAYLNLTESLVVSEEEAEQNVESKKWIKLSLATDGDDTTTGISEIASEEQNARIDDDIIYNLNGIRVTNPSKGIYIKNGKKYIIK